MSARLRAELAGMVDDKSTGFYIPGIRKNGHGPQENARQAVPIRGGTEMDLMQGWVSTSPQVGAWLKDITNAQSLTTNANVVTQWVLASSGASKKHLVEELKANPILTEERHLVNTKDVGFLYALFPVLPGREPVGEICRQYFKLHVIFYTGVEMVRNNQGVSEYRITPP